MSKILTVCSLGVALLVAPASYAAQLGTPCSSLGVTQISSDQVNILACLKTSTSNGTLVWKAMTPVTPRAADIYDGLAIGQFDGDNTQSIQTYIDTGAGGGYGNWSYAGGCCHPLFLNPHGGLVGVGTTNPTRMLDVSGDINATRNNGTGAYYFASDWNRYLYFDGTNYAFGAGGLYVGGGNMSVAGSMNVSGGMTVSNGMNVTSSMSVAGDVKVGNSGAGCGSGNAGALRWVGVLQVCNGSSWVATGGGLTFVGTCTTPSSYRATTACKCNAGETFMMMSGFVGSGNWADFVQCRVDGQNSGGVTGFAYYGASVSGTCTFECFK